MTKLPRGRIGGHRGLDVKRLDSAPANIADGWAPTFIEKTALHEIGNQGQPPPDGLFGVDLYGMNVSAVHNEAAMLCEMESSHYTPKLIDIVDDESWQEDMSVSEIPLDAEVWRQNLVRMLATIRSRGLRHGDLRGSNIITRGDEPYAIDWQEAHYIGDVPPQKSPYSDSMLLMQHIIGTIGPTGVADVPRVARRWGQVIGALGATTDLTLPLRGKTFLDLGCFQGDFTALAASEGMNALGVDQGGFRVGENSIEIARRLWDGFRFGDLRFTQQNIAGHTLGFMADVTIMFSTWSYIVKDFGRDQAEEVLRAAIAGAGDFFFENQLAGDGPGPAFFRTDDDIEETLTRLGGRAVKAIGTFPVTGRPASRTVWRVQS